MGLFGSNKKAPATQDLDWGAVTPERYNAETKEAFYVCNFFLKTPEARDLAELFLSGRISFYQLHLPEGSSHKIRMDIRGQHVSFDRLREWKEKLVKRLQGNNTEINVKIDFYTD